MLGFHIRSVLIYTSNNTVIMYVCVCVCTCVNILCMMYQHDAHTLGYCAGVVLFITVYIQY